ncbi:EscU/YscU/HrcU family type III secretion system export apparatus switch protein [Pelomonas sp. CA6]|uniref:EscU/YscU/HrcU family type III secretion system export apparatus switch protein n=1 Tax=Pelomonas sp. CA6 TaxID=2907999 RepID=UPI001F4C4E57|nr:EscU/YscU/HrcU family type III secretion system export apparatus switch protein [Pelomonas sp. CA6]MCH7345086.1 EscU/YscU/HrcU family type III secretion system export apparatus switch protein [Pelomonas sp. CA6]
MADSGGDKTEKPTPKRLLDARKKGDVPKSRDLSATVTLIVWLLLFALLVRPAADSVRALCELLFESLGQGWRAGDFARVARAVGWASVECLGWISAALLLPVAAAGLLTEFLQVGAVWAMDKVSPKLQHLDPSEGIKRMFSMDSLVELLKNIAKSAVLLGLGWLLVRHSLPDWMALVRQHGDGGRTVGTLLWDASWRLIAWAIGAFLLVAMLDAVWQRHSFTKKMRMSLRDIRQEFKDNEGDPLLKQQRKQAHAEWSQQNASQAARLASALVVNPTHVAVAIDYDRERCPVPVVSAKGEGEVAAAMRAAAEEAGVPIVRNVPLARDLLARAETGEVIPPDLFDIVAEVVLWAAELRREMAQGEGAAMGNADGQGAAGRRPAPGEDVSVRHRAPRAGSAGGAAGHSTADDPSRGGP